MLSYVQGNLLDTKRKIIGHGVNCKGVFGLGIAKQIARQFPFVRTAYLNKYKQDQWTLGDLQLVPVGDKIFANMATQDTYGRSGIHVNYEACFQVFSLLFRYASMHMMDIALPKVGSGLGGGQWHLVEKELMKALNGYEIAVDVYYL